MEQLKKQKFILHDDLFEKLRLEYEKCEYCLIDEVRLYKYYGDYRLISEEYFQRKRNSEFIIGRIYTCNEIQSVKTKIALEAYHGITRYKAIEKQVSLIKFSDVETLQNGVYDVLGVKKGILYVPNEEETEQIIKNKHRRVKANGLKRILKWYRDK